MACDETPVPAPPGGAGTDSRITTGTRGRRRGRPAGLAVLAAGLLCATAACGGSSGSAAAGNSTTPPPSASQAGTSGGQAGTSGGQAGTSGGQAGTSGGQAGAPTGTAPASGSGSSVTASAASPSLVTRLTRVARQDWLTNHGCVFASTDTLTGVRLTSNGWAAGQDIVHSGNGVTGEGPKFVFRRAGGRWNFFACGEEFSNQGVPLEVIVALRI